MSEKRALITGITGQDGSYLAELLLAKGYEVHGIIRRASSFNTDRIDHIYQDPHESGRRLFLHYGDLTDASNLSRLIERIEPNEIYNLGAQSHVQVSFEVPEYTAQVDALGTLRLLDAIKQTGVGTRFYQASTSELYGKVVETPQNEKTPFYPRSPYACAKLYAYWLVVNYREAYDLFACNGILFNHESPRRGETFVTRKITRAVARIAAGVQACVFLGNLDAKRDWGYAPEYVEAMWRMLQHESPIDLVVATGETHSVREFLEHAFARVEMPIQWRGEGIEEHAVTADGRVVVRIDPKYFRPTEVDLLLGDPSLAHETIGWTPQVTFRELVEIHGRRRRRGAERRDVTEPLVIAVVALPPPMVGQSFASRALIDGFETRGIPHEVVDLTRPILDRSSLRARADRIVDALLRFPIQLCGAALRRRGRPAVVYAQLSWGRLGMLRDLPVVFTARALGFPVVGHIHGGGFRASFDGLPTALRHLVRRSLDSVARVIVIEAQFAPSLDDVVDSNRVRVVVNATDDRFRARLAAIELRDVSRARPLNVLFLSHLMADKGYEIVLEAARLAARRDLPLKFALVGAPADETTVDPNRWIDEHGLDNLTYHGPVYGDERVPHFAWADVFVLPSRYTEGITIAALEAMAAGLPVVLAERAGTASAFDSRRAGRALDRSFCE